MQVLSNHAAIQAVWHSELKIAMVAFRKPGFLATPAGRLGVDHSCLLLVRKIEGRWKISASNPENRPLILHVELRGRGIEIDLPDGNFAGSSVTTNLPVA
jgi:Polysaccharide lyase family 8, C-terminal beta-sandwich domain